MQKKNTRRGFTLIELLVVVLIIGILAAVAVPQYQKAIEKSRITEAIVNLRAIANANQVYYLANGEYATKDDMDKLDVDIPGTIYEGSSFAGRTTTQYFVYSPNGESGQLLAVAWRIDMDESNTIISAPYQLTIKVTDPEKIHCDSRDNASAVQKKLCREIEQNGTL